MEIRLLGSSIFAEGHYYSAGKWQKSAKSNHEVRNPADNSLVGLSANAGYEETQLVIESAAKGFKQWKALSALERSQILKKFHGLVISEASTLARIMTLEQGKPIKESEKEILYGAAYIEWFAEEARRINGEIIAAPQTNKKILVLKEPVGVCAAITPWNFPHAMIVRKLAAALASGCSFIGKPAPETPLSALAIAALAHEAGVPPGVLNIVTGEAEPIVKAFMDSQVVKKISFTGSTEVGKILIRQSAESIKRLTMELGGNAPLLVFEDADIDKAAHAAAFAKFRNAGQTCVSVNRFLVQKSVASQFIAKFVEITRTLKIGPGTEKDSDIGPLINQQALSKVKNLLENAISNGAKIECGKIPTSNSLFVFPVVLSGINSKMDICREEIFGPVAAMQIFDNEEEALRLANNTQYGLVSYVFTKDLSRAMRVTEALESGMVGVNDTAISLVEAPFGGIKESGYGREGSSYGVQDYINLKYVCLGIE